MNMMMHSNFLYFFHLNFFKRRKHNFEFQTKLNYTQGPERKKNFLWEKEFTFSAHLSRMDSKDKNTKKIRGNLNISYSKRTFD